MTGPLAGQGALITGGAGGFGTAIARALARDGAAVTLLGRTEGKLRSAVDDITAGIPGAQVRFVVGDAAAEADVERAVAVADSTPLRICVATVGGGTMGSVMMLDAATVRADFERNVITALHLIRFGAAAMAPHGGGSVICTSSTAGGFPFPFMASYSVAKSALEALVRVSADELAHLGIRVNAIRPGLVPTGAEKPGILAEDEEQRQLVLREKPLARVGTVEDVAAAARYLAGPESSWVTGVVLPVEGGSHLRRAADLERLARHIHGDDAVDRAVRGMLPAR
ncbi:SDR family oxidoreductase [Dactylosporangium salmoneum]|uniref:SDR family oxidoreductase n=1 Tax=Dactylosporangium salmoneum TaxID=53361 RepID=A0ABN3GRA6_9ACTN